MSIFEQGEKGDKAYLLLDGRIAIEVNGKFLKYQKWKSLVKCH